MASQVVLAVSHTCQRRRHKEHRLDPQIRKICSRKWQLTQYSYLENFMRTILQQRPDRLQTMGSQRVGSTETSQEKSCQDKRLWAEGRGHVKGKHYRRTGCSKSQRPSVYWNTWEQQHRLPTGQALTTAGICKVWGAPSAAKLHQTLLPAGGRLQAPSLLPGSTPSSPHKVRDKSLIPFGFICHGLFLPLKQQKRPTTTPRFLSLLQTHLVMDTWHYPVNTRGLKQSYINVPHN